MPELPEAETVARQLRAGLLGATLTALVVQRPDIVQQGLATSAWYQGCVLDSVERRGKSVVLGFQKSGLLRYLVAELGMTGLLLFLGRDQSYAKHTHVRMSFSGGSVEEVGYWNPRRFGRISLLDELGLSDYTERRFGLDPLAMSWESFWDALHAKRVRIKSLLMDQRWMAGVGNIYANEILFRAGIHPERRADRLSQLRGRRLFEQTQAVLREAIECGGSSIRDFIAPNGERGRFASRHLVYGKADQPCPSLCGDIVRLSKGARTSFYCPRCQK
ncbi:MAG: bifunctional DNA-formamidopyrimidine glycosylase/DNA-(apurinic or apyrimidinic site) lyase [Nitrospiraceae bacterium]